MLPANVPTHRNRGGNREARQPEPAHDNRPSQRRSRQWPWPAEAEDQKRYLETLLDQVRQALTRAERDHWLLFDQHHGANVTWAYTELE